MLKVILLVSLIYLKYVKYLKLNIVILPPQVQFMEKIAIFHLKKNTQLIQFLFYAATKICNEILAQSYSQMTNTKFVGLRFFTVYGPNGRPDMSIYKFIKNLFDKKAIEIFNQGKHARDYFMWMM